MLVRESPLWCCGLRGGLQRLFAVEVRVGSLAQWVKGFGTAAVVAQVTAEARIQSLAWECLCAMGAAIRKKKKKKNRLASSKSSMVVTVITNH